MNYKKYLKYKLKYLNLKKIYGGHILEHKNVYSYKPADEPADDPANVPADEPADDPANVPADDSADDSSDDSDYDDDREVTSLNY